MTVASPGRTNRKTSRSNLQVETTFRVPRATVALEFTVYDSSIRPDATPPGEIRFG